MQKRAPQSGGIITQMRYFVFGFTNDKEVDV
jgi:hypothetical protein